MEYPKTENLYARDPETKVAGPQFGFRVPEVELISKWLVLEKVDGMNMRVIWSPDEDNAPRIAGRTDRAQIPGDLLARMNEYFTYEKMMATFSYYVDHGDGTSEHHRPETVVLFGEGYGAGIQSGGHYRADKGFILFDVVVDGHWLSWVNVQDVAAKLGVPTVPVLCEACPLEDVKETVVVRASGLTDAEHVEGVIARTDPYLFDGRGRRVMFKYKVRDL